MADERTITVTIDGFEFKSSDPEALLVLVEQARMRNASAHPGDDSGTTSRTETTGDAGEKPKKKAGRPRKERPPTDPDAPKGYAKRANKPATARKPKREHTVRAYPKEITQRMAEEPRDRPASFTIPFLEAAHDGSVAAMQFLQDYRITNYRMIRAALDRMASDLAKVQYAFPDVLQYKRITLDDGSRQKFWVGKNDIAGAIKKLKEWQNQPSLRIAEEEASA